MSRLSAARRLVGTMALLGFLSVGCAKVSSKVEEVVAAPDSAEAMLVGTWQMPLERLGEIDGVLTEEQQAAAADGPQLTMVFTEDGKVRSSMDNRADDYIVQGELVVVNGRAMTFDVNESELTLIGPEQTLVLTRVGEGADESQG